MAIPACGAHHAEGLKVDYRENPLGVDSQAPRFSWHLESNERNTRQSAYQIQVSTNLKALNEGNADLWDSGKVISSQSIGVAYKGRPLTSRMRCYWRVRVWNGADLPSAFSAPAHYEMALLRSSDWKARWISSDQEVVFEGRNGYHSEFSEDTNATKWVSIDLGSSQGPSKVVLYPARPYNWQHDDPGFGFPIRYRIELSNQPDFKDSVVIADRTETDQPNPGTESVNIPLTAHTGRYIRLVATRLHHPKDTTGSLLALTEMAVLDQQGKNLALGKSVSAADSIEHSGWSRGFLTDGRERPGMTQIPPAPLLRREFTLNKPIVQARAYVTGLGYYELHINGKRVGDRVLDPPYSTYSKRIYYSTYDVTDLLRQGNNAIGAILGYGWWKQNPRLLMQLEVVHPDGSRTTLISDGNWRWAESPILENSIYNGETYDARLAVAGWDRPGFNDEKWTNVVPCEGAGGVLSSEMIPPIRVIQTLSPKARTNPKPGVYVFDLGQNFSGWCRLKLSGPAGTKVTLRHSELLYPDGSVNTENLRSARATDTYILSGRGTEIYEPRFTYHGFRYVQVEGFPGEPPMDSLEGRVVHTDLAPAGEFACSNEMINQVQRNCQWTLRTNFHSIPTDCPQRDERQGWMCDAHIAAYMAMYNFDMVPAYIKFLRDIADAQGDDGRIPDTVPHIWGSDPGDPMWSVAYHVILWEMYRHTGDQALLQSHYEGMKSYLEMLHREAKDGIITRNNYGDWIGVVPTPSDLISTGTYYLTCKLVADAAATLGRDEDAATYRKLSAEIADAFNKRYWDAQAGVYGNGSQTSNSFPLWLGIVPPVRHEAVLKALVQDIEVNQKGHLSSGLVGTRYLFDLLSREGRTDVAYTMAAQKDYPGWGYMLQNGATTIWELWNLATGPGMNSHNHPWAACISGWFYEALAGIQPDASHPGWERFTIKPHMPGDLKWAEASVQTLRGRIHSRWERSEKGILLKAEIPANSHASVCMPTDGKTAYEITESGTPVWSQGRYQPGKAGILSAQNSGDSIQFEVGSGSYVFELK